jgi:hypothetical protein
MRFPPVTPAGNSLSPEYAIARGYFVQIARRREIYFGRNGEFHVEQFANTSTKRTARGLRE